MLSIKHHLIQISKFDCLRTELYNDFMRVNYEFAAITRSSFQLPRKGGIK